MEQTFICINKKEMYTGENMPKVTFCYIVADSMDNAKRLISYLHPDCEWYIIAESDLRKNIVEPTD